MWNFQEERQKAYQKEKKKKRKTQESVDIDDEMNAIMGFSGFKKSKN